MIAVKSKGSSRAANDWVEAASRSCYRYARWEVS